MEKFLIAQYGMIQMTALAYGILASGIMVKAGKYIVDQGRTLPTPIKVVTFFHDYGIYLSLVIIFWTAYCSFHSTTFSKRNIDEGSIVTSGLVLSGIFFVLAVFLTFMGLAALFPSST